MNCLEILYFPYTITFIQGTINCYMLFVLLILFALSKICMNGTVSPIQIQSSTSQLFQIGAFELSSADIMPFTAATSTHRISNFPVSYINTYVSPNCGVGYKKLNWNYPSSYLCTMSIYQFCNPTDITVHVHAGYGNILYLVQVSTIVINSSLTSDLKSNFMSLPLASTSYATNQLVTSTRSHSFAGVISQTKVYPYITRIDLQALGPLQYVGISPITFTSITSTTLTIALTFTNAISNATVFQFFVLFFNPLKLITKNIYVDYAYLSSGDVTGPPFIFNLHTDSSPCSGYQHFYIGMIQFKSYDVLSFQLSTDSLKVNLTINNFNTLAYLKFSSVKICDSLIQCSNTSYPFLHRVDSLCYDVCPTGYYGNLTTTYCQLCDSNCFTCDTEMTNCTSCVNGTLIFLNFTCVLNCPNQTIYDPSTNQCFLCTGNCEKCQQTQTNCTSCINGTFLLSFECLQNCPAGYYQNTQIKQCEICETQCVNCSSFTQCFACANNSFLYNFSCTQSCPNQTYGDISVNQCLNCTGTCQNCNVSSTNCTSCINNTFYLNFDCLFNCSIGFYANSSTGKCQFCPINCSSCTAINICTQCVYGMLLSPTFDKCSNTCPPNYFPNFTLSQCQQIIIPGCMSALYSNGISICLICNFTLNLKYNSTSRSCVCKNGYKLNNGQCEQFCGDGIVMSMSCDDGNFNNGDGCSSKCMIQNNFNCTLVPNGPTLTSLCTYLPEIGIQILSQTKVKDQNTLKLILKIIPVPSFLSSDQIRKFLNLKIANQTIDINHLRIDYQNGIAQIFVPFTSDIQGEQLSLWTNFDKNKFSSFDVRFISILKGDNVALLFTTSLTLYKVLGIFNFSMAICVCIFALFSFYKHKMIGLELIMPIQVILYSQNFYDLKTLQTTLYSAFKPASFSIFTPDQTGSKSNSLYRNGMTGGFLENYNFLGLLFLISTILMISCIFKLQSGERNRFKRKKGLRDWLKFGQFKIIIRRYQTIIWKLYYVSFCLSTIPLIFSISAKAMTTESNSPLPQTIFDIINDKLNYLFCVLFMGAFFYTSIPRIFYNNKKSLLKKHIFKQEGQKFKYDASYCMYFQIQYMLIGLIYATCSPTLIIFYVISAVNGLFLFYLILKRPYESTLDNIGALLSNFIVSLYLSLNLFFKITDDKSAIASVSKISGFTISFLLLTQFFIAFIRLYIFWVNDKDQNLKGLSSDQKIVKFKYQRDKAFNKFVVQNGEQNQFRRVLNNLQNSNNKNGKISTINQQLLQKAYSRQKANDHKKNQKVGNKKQDFGVYFDQQQKFQARNRVKKDMKQQLNIYLVDQKKLKGK